MASKNVLPDGRNLGIAGGILSIISVFLPWYSASASAGKLVSSSISVNGLGFGLYFVLLGGAVAGLGGLLTWRKING
ncbi:MAG: hypothetical protein D4R88_07845 [Methanosarcinales archaeon]|nr:MAG: hypothetical protein D4R88_07845 [Methanosarcinales archaeon]